MVERGTDTVDCSEANDTLPAYVHTVAPDPRRQDPIDNPRIAEEGCLGVTQERKYYKYENPEGPVFIKRNLTPSEYMVNYYGELVLPRMSMERLKNEAAAIRYIQSHTNIFTPNIRCAFEDHGRYYLITDLVPGVRMADLPDEKKAPVIEELKGYVAQMHTITSKVMGGLSGEVILPYRVARAMPPNRSLQLREATSPEFVLCHNDLSQHNVILDETTLKIKAILDWEYAGFFPPEFDRPFYLRVGPSVAMKGEEDDVPQLLEVLESWKAADVLEPIAPYSVPARDLGGHLAVTLLRIASAPYTGIPAYGLHVDGWILAIRLSLSYIRRACVRWHFMKDLEDQLEKAIFPWKLCANSFTTHAIAFRLTMEAMPILKDPIPPIPPRVHITTRADTEVQLSLSTTQLIQVQQIARFTMPGEMIKCSKCNATYSSDHGGCPNCSVAP
ncbi:putative integral peroxisomal membrane peroxin [Lyophyllum shimeji]|uniref:Integral peroxisomal membrane peroxin n=1 Tax=Lyophyllum shimeji TaxID=47721 RepID=A0A9P3UKV2_LYOSH|nr:putative integral peroxisomal membrane peroxin [Lyophyllum shimeji]